MNFRSFIGRVLAAGVVLTAIFITISTVNIVSGAEPELPVPEQRSRLHPKRIFNGLKRGVAKLFGRDKDEEESVQSPTETLPTTPPPAVADQINQQRIALESARRDNDPYLPPRSAGDAEVDRSLPLTAPTIARSPQVMRAPSRKIELGTPQPQVTSEIAQFEPEEENPFADINFDAPMFDEPASQVIEAAISAEKPPVTRNVVHASQQRQTAPEVKHLLGYCPVSLRAGEFQRGRAEFSTIYQGRSYRFASQAALNAFVRDPGLYAPVLQGIDVVEMQRTGRHVEGFLSFSCDYDGQYYLFRSSVNQETFLEDPARYAVPR